MGTPYIGRYTSTSRKKEDEPKTGSLEMEPIKGEPINTKPAYIVDTTPKKSENYFTVVTEDKDNKHVEKNEKPIEVPTDTSKQETTATETPEYQKYIDLQNQYIKEYLGRDDFNYDVNADELYNIYRKQALDTAKKARRDAVAQAAGLTGGYGSSYAAQLGNAAYKDIMSEADAMIPEFYNFALSKYNSEGEGLLEKADIAGKYAEQLKAGEGGDLSADELIAILNGDPAENYEAAQKVRTAHSRFNPWGDNNNETTIYDEAMRIFAGVATGKNADVGEDKLGEMIDMSEKEIRNELMTWVTKDGEKLSKDEVDYLVNEINSARQIAYYKSLVDASGVSLASYLEALQNEDLDGAEFYERLKSWKDKSGATLSDEDVLTLIAYYL